MLFNGSVKRAQKHLHPYLSGNFAPIRRVLPLTPCTFTGSIPEELAGGQYVRNGGNPLTNEDLGRDAHWFDGDGMLSGVLFSRVGEGGSQVSPQFVNQYILTDVLLASKGFPFLKTPILPSISTLVNPLNSLLVITLSILRTLLLVLLTHLPGSKQVVKRISVANTGVLYHDGRALATCESGPPIRVLLPSLETVGWFNGKRAEGEPVGDEEPGYGGQGFLSFMKEWTTGHPRVDPSTAELISFHSTFAPPYVHYSIVPATHHYPGKAPLKPAPSLDMPVPGIAGARMMHDFGVSLKHTVIMDLPLSLDPLNLAKNKPVVSYDPTSKSRFGIFPRYCPDQVRWFETNPCCIFHTANSWDSIEKSPGALAEMTVVNLLACRLTSASLVYSAGDLAAPTPLKPVPAEYQEEEQCRLYYYQFALCASGQNVIRAQWALSAMSFEFPSLRNSKSMSNARYIYGCSNSAASFSAALGRAVKIDFLAKIDVQTLIAKGIANPPEQIKGCVDTRSVEEVLSSQDPDDPIRVFQMPKGWYAQESRFVLRDNGISEDDGWLLSYVFDESQLDDRGECLTNARSELWIIDAKNMTDVVAKVALPQRVPYGLHGNWFSEDEIRGQRPITTLRTTACLDVNNGDNVILWRSWMWVRAWSEKFLA